MTHVKIGRSERGGHTLEVDGIDLTPHALAKGFEVTFGEVADQVHVTIAADTLDLDLPVAALVAIRATESPK